MNRLLAMLVPLALIHMLPASADAVRQAGIAADPGWEGYRNRLLPDPPRVTRQSFGYQITGHAGGRKAGEIGGWVKRSATLASYAKSIPPRSLNDRLMVRGKFAVTKADNGSGTLIGWFNDQSRGWRTPNSLALRIDGNGGKYWVFFEYGTRSWQTGGGHTFEGSRYQTTKTKPFPADGTVHTWELTYDPAGNQNNGALSLVLDGQHFAAGLEPGHKADGAVFNRFGIWNQQLTGKGMEVYFDDLEVDGVAENFDRDPSWLGRGNEVSFIDRVFRPYHDFGFSSTAYVGGQKGEIGGVIWRDPAGAYYADRVGPFTLDHELAASGKLALVAGAADSAVSFGWFDANSQKRPGKKRNVLGLLVEGPSRVGHYFRPEYFTAAGESGIRTTGPVLRPDGKPHTWAIHYDPKGAGGRGRMTFRLDDVEEAFDLEPGRRTEGATFDRFGLLARQPADGHYVEFYLANLKYSRQAPGSGK